MRVRYLVSSAGHGFTVEAGQEREVSEELGRRLVSLGRAVPVASQEVETAAVQPGATKRRRKKSKHE